MEFRPVSHLDRSRVGEIFGAAGEMLEAFDTWVTDPSALFEVGELDGEVVAVHRVRLIGDDLAWYEGLGVIPEGRGRGVGAAMVARAKAEAARIGAGRLRAMTTGGSDTGPDRMPGAGLLKAAGFRRLLALELWLASRLEGGEECRLPGPEEADRLFQLIEAHALSGYAGVFPGGFGVLDLAPETIGRLARRRQVLTTSSGGSLALLAGGPGLDALEVALVAGAPAALTDLLMSLRYEADLAGLPGAGIWAPAGSDLAQSLERAGYDNRQNPAWRWIHELSLGPWR